MAAKALLIIAPKDFRDEEYFHTKEELEKAGMSVTTASTAPSCRGMLGGSASPDIAMENASVDDYDAVVFIGGSGSSIYFNDRTALRIARDAAAKGKLLAAICIAPSILANAGLLKGKKVSSFPSEEGNIASQGGEWTGEPLSVDGRIITANGPAAARAFGRAIAEALQ